MAKRDPRRITLRRTGRAAAAPPGSTSNTKLLYVESSALLAALLENDTAAREAFRAGGLTIASALTFAEAARAIVRARVTGRLSVAQERDAIRALRSFERSCDIVSVTDEILARAGRPFPHEPIRTLDAIHLATAEILGEPPQLVTIVTRDNRLSENARAMGYAVA